MLKESIFPILEFDSNKQAKLQPSSIIQKTPVPNACVITFFKEVINKKLESGELEQIGTSPSETVDIPIYETKYNGCHVGLVGGFVGAAGSAAFFAVSKFRNVLLGQILYGGDDLSGIEWNNRSWISREKIRTNLVDLCLKIAVEL